MPLIEVQSKKLKANITIKPKPKFLPCQEHEIELKFYCETCDQLVCHYCIMKDHLKHDPDHDTEENGYQAQERAEQDYGASSKDD